MLAFECDPAVHGRVWALRAAPSTAIDAANNPHAVGSSSSGTSTSVDSGGWADCSGDLQIDLDSGQLHSQPTRADGSSRVPIRFDLQWAGCSTLLPSFESTASSLVAAKTLDGGSPPTREAACWLSRFFGPHAHWQGPPNFVIELLGTSVALETDLVVRSGTNLRLTSSTRTTVVVGPHQVRVEPGARLELDGLTLADSVQSSALVIGGSAAALRTTFLRCHATTNTILSGVMDSLVPDGVGAFLAAAGAAVHIGPGASMEIVDSVLLGCSVGGARIAAAGGAVFVNSRAQLVVLRSELRRNSAEGGAYCTGGAIFLHIGANATLQASVIGENMARGGSKLTAGGAAMILLSAQMIVHTTEACHNQAVGEGVEYVGGGGFGVYSSARLVVAQSLLCYNRAVNNGDKGGVGGGAIRGFPGSRVTATRSVFESNTASGGADSYGGSVHMAQSSEANFVSTLFVGNSVDGASGSNYGGALRLDSNVRLRMTDSELRNNTASGAQPRGGAIASDAVEAVLVNTTLVQNRVVASRGQAAGGAVASAGILRFEGCRLHGNVAESLRGSLVAWGGAVYVSSGAVRIEGSSLRGNRMGGLGVNQQDANENTGSGARGGAHVLAEWGVEAVLDRCRLVEDGVSGEEPRLENAAEWWLSAAQSLVLHNSSFRSTTPGQGLLQIQGPQLQLMIRGCAFENVWIGVAHNVTMQSIGVVDSTFAPALDMIETVQPTTDSACGERRAGEQVCDPRALCEGVRTGGVRCSCVGSGLRYKPGIPEDGQHCEQGISLRAVLESESVGIDVVKPGSLSNRTLTLIAEAHGEAELNVTLSVSMTRFEASSGAIIVANKSIRVGEPSISAFGQHIEWKELPPAATWHADLDKGRLKFANISRYEFAVRLACDGAEQSCAADGDVITTALQLASPHDGRLRSEVRVITQVRSLLSCLHTRADLRVEPNLERVPIATAIRVQLFARDVDNLPVSFTRADINLVFGARNIPMQWRSGSSEYAADVPSELTGEPGLYDLVVNASNVWNETGPATGCELLRRTIIVQGSLSTSWILVGAGGAAVMVVGGLVLVVRKRHAHLQAIMVMLFTEVRSCIILIHFYAETPIQWCAAPHFRWVLLCYYRCRKYR
jgi:hypothetical protein